MKKIMSLEYYRLNACDIKTGSVRFWSFWDLFSIFLGTRKLIGNSRYQARID